jgi:HlyD family secretion protein
MKRIFVWTLLLILVAGVAVGATLVLTGRELPFLSRQTVESPTTVTVGDTTFPITQTVEVRSAESVIGRVSAAGNIALSRQHYVVLTVEGRVSDVLVHPGDVITAGQLLLSLDTTDLERSVRRAQLSVATSQNALAQLQEPATTDAIAEAEANLLSAEESLQEVQAGATEAEIAAARASVNAAWAKYRDLTDGLTEAERTKMEAQLRTAEISLQEAQREYDKVAWANDSGTLQQSANLQKATIEYERVKAEYETQIAVSQSDVQSALSQAREAEQKLTDLLAQPTAKDLASAGAQVASARTKLADLAEGADALQLEAEQIKLEQALVELEEAYSRLEQAKVTAPLAGTVMEVNAEVGQRLTTGQTVVVLANTTELELPVQVAEVDIDQIAVGQPAEITIDALLGRDFAGEVVRIAPASEKTNNVINYEVVIRLAGDDLAGVRPDMTAVAEFVNSEAMAGWLVPTTAIYAAGDVENVTVLRDNQPLAVSVRPGTIQGEWTVVQAPELQLGDQVIGRVTSYEANEDYVEGFGPPR